MGVLPASFSFYDREIDIWSPLIINPAQNNGDGRWLGCLARLKPSVTLKQAQTEMFAVAQQRAVDDPAFNKGWTVSLQSLHDALVRNVKSSLMILLGSVALLLAVACANVANLLLARYTARQREVALRTSIGAGRSRVARQLLTESVLLAAVGGATGMLLARWAVSALVLLAPKDLTQSIDVNVDLRIYFFAAGLAGSNKYFVRPGTGSRWIADRVGPNHANGKPLQYRPKGSPASLVCRVGGCVLGCIAERGSALISQPGRTAACECGHKCRQTFSCSVFRFPAANTRSHHRLSSSLPGRFKKLLLFREYAPLVQSVICRSGDWCPPRLYRLPGAPEKTWRRSIATIRAVLPGYFKTMGIPLLGGRDFTAADDREDTPHRFIVSQAFAHKYLGKSNPLDQQISVWMEDKNPFGQIIGVVADARDETLDQAPTPTVYYPHAHLAYNRMVIVVRPTSDPLALTPSIRSVIRSLDPAQPIADVKPMSEVVAATYSRQRFSTLLLAGFSIASLLLAGVGVYGILTYAVSTRTRELGVRIAVGATPGRVISLIIRAAATPVFVGLLAGMAGAFALTGLLQSLLFNVSPRDPLTFAVIPAILAIVALFAAYLPARRASLLDSMECLRAE